MTRPDERVQPTRPARSFRMKMPWPGRSTRNCWASSRMRGGMHMEDGNPNVDRGRAQELVANLRGGLWRSFSCGHRPAAGCTSVIPQRVPRTSFRPCGRCPHHRRRGPRRPSAPGACAAWPTDRPRAPHNPGCHHRCLFCLEESTLHRRHLHSCGNRLGTRSALGFSASPAVPRRLPLRSCSAGREVSRRQVR